MLQKNNVVFVALGLLVIAASLGIFVFQNTGVLTRPLQHDEVDYVVCAEQGMWHNAVGKQTLTLPEFVQLGKYKAAKDSVNIVRYASTLPNANQDVFVLRHYHPPLPVYVWSLFANGTDRTNTSPLRWSNWLLILLSGALFFFILKSVNVSNRNLVIGLLIWAVLVNTSLFSYAFSSLNFHTYLGVAAVFAVFAVLRYLQTKSAKNWWIMALALALMLVTLESAVFVVALIVGAIVVTNFRKQFTIKTLLQLAVATVVLCIVLWPSFLLNGELIKSVGMYFSRIFVNENLEYNEVNYWANWWEVIKLAPIWFGLILAIQLVHVNRIIRQKELLLPVLVGWGYCLLMTPFILNKTYIIPGVFLLTFSAIWIVVSTEKSNLSAPLLLVTTVLAAGMALFGTEKNKWYKPEEGAQFWQAVNKVEKLTEQGQVLMFPGHIYQYYIGESKITGLGHPKINYNGFTKRYDYTRADISQDIANGKYKFVLIPAASRYTNWQQQLEKMGMQRVNGVYGFYTYQFSN